MVLLMIVLLTILIVPLMLVSMSENMFTINQKKRMQAYYIAYSGVNAVADYIVKDQNGPVKALELAGKTATDTSHFSNGELKIEAATSSGGILTLTGTGMVGGIENSVKLILQKLASDYLIDKAIYSNEALKISQVRVLDGGEVQSGGLVTFTTTGTHAFDANKQLSFSKQSYALNNFIESTSSDIVSDPLELIATADTRYDYGKILLDHETLKIVPNGHTVQLAVNEIDIKKGNLIIDIAPGDTTSKVELYINNRMELDVNGLINNQDPYHFFIYLQDGSEFVTQANEVINGYIIGPNATIRMTSGNTEIHGAIIGNVVLKANNDNAPLGNVYWVPLKEVDIGDKLLRYQILRWEK